MFRVFQLITQMFWTVVFLFRSENVAAEPPEPEEVELIDINEVGTQQNTEPDITPWQVVSGLSAVVLSRENLPRIGIATVLTALSTSLNFLSPWLLGKTINLLSNNEQSTEEIAGVEFTYETLITLYAFILLLSQIIPNVRDQVMIPVTEKNTQKILLNCTEHLLLESLDFHVNTPFSDLIYLVQKAFSVSMVGTPLLTQIAPTLVEITIACTLLSYRYGFEMGLSLLILLTAYTVYCALTVKPIIEIKELMIKVGNDTWTSFTNALTRYKAIHDFGQLNYTIKGVDKALSRMTQTDIKASLKPLQIGLGHYAISGLAFLLATLYIGKGVKQKEYSIQDFLMITGYLGSLSGLLKGFAGALTQLFASYPDLKFVFAELAKPNKVVDLHPETPLIIPAGTTPIIEFEQVSFIHTRKKGESENQPLFENLSFTVKAGKKTALVSKSGAGKTTIFNMLFGYYKPNSGVIKINGQNINEISLNSLRAHISILGQTPNLFKGSIRENICFGAENPDEVNDESIWELARAMNLESFLQSFAEQLDTDVGEEGKTISGGQQQKVAILRGLIKKSPIRLLDEITASLDSGSANEVLQGINNNSEGKTTLMITHKLTEAKTADDIIVLDEGRVIAQGTHQELLESCILYQQLWQSNNHQPEPSSSTTRVLLALGGKGQPTPLLSESEDDIFYGGDIETFFNEVDSRETTYLSGPR